MLRRTKHDVKLPGSETALSLGNSRTFEFRTSSLSTPAAFRTCSLTIICTKPSHWLGPVREEPALIPGEVSVVVGNRAGAVRADVEAPDPWVTAPEPPVEPTR